jgi:hypothetical protein
MRTAERQFDFTITTKLTKVSPGDYQLTCFGTTPKGALTIV